MNILILLFKPILRARYIQGLVANFVGVLGRNMAV